MSNRMDTMMSRIVHPVTWRPDSPRRESRPTAPAFVLIALALCGGCGPSEEGTDPPSRESPAANQAPIVQIGADQAVEEVYGRYQVAVSGTVKHHSTYAGIQEATIRIAQFDGVAHVVGVTETGPEGHYSVRIRANQGRLTVSSDAHGFASQSIIVNLKNEPALIANLNMIPVLVEQQFQAQDPFDVLFDGRVLVSLPSNALVDADGNGTSGSSTIRVTVLDPTRDPSVMPGDFERWNAEAGKAEPIESFGAMNVVFEDVASGRLSLGDGHRANISIPLAVGRSPEESPASVPLFYWSETRGYWIEEGKAILEETTTGRWAYTGEVGHFSTWNADFAYASITLNGCVSTQDGEPVQDAEVTARGSDYVGSSKATTDADGQFEVRVRPDSELELYAVAAGPLYSEAIRLRSQNVDTALGDCLEVFADGALRDFPMQIIGETARLEICVRDHECEDGDRISVLADGRPMFSDEITNEWICEALDVRAGRSYEVELTALNGTGHKGNCSYADVNTGEIRVTGENTETQTWRHRGGEGSQARIVVESLPTPTASLIRRDDRRIGCTEILGSPCQAQMTTVRDNLCQEITGDWHDRGWTEVAACACRYGRGIFGGGFWRCEATATKSVELLSLRRDTATQAQESRLTEPIVDSFYGDFLGDGGQNEACAEARIKADEWGAEALSACECWVVQYSEVGDWTCGVAAMKNE